VTQDWNSLNESQFKNAFAYFVTYGTRQSGADVSANYAAIAGVKQNGDTTRQTSSPMTQWTIGEEIRPRLYRDRKAFADAYFSKLETERVWTSPERQLRSADVARHMILSPATYSRPISRPR